MRDTIFAPVTAAGRAAVAVVRVSGPEASRLAKTIAGPLPKARQASLRRLSSNDVVVDEGLVIWMPGPGSFTGEDCVEFQVHGGLAVVEGLCSILARAGARLAEPGEFTRRAFEAGRLDLTQAEAIADLVDAQSEAQRAQAMGQLSGALADRYRVWRERLLDALAFLEAGIDFPEEDVPDGVVSDAIPIAEGVATDIASELSYHGGERTRDGMTIALIGSPNVGKSSLLNLLAGREAAIVTPLPGTTRDVIEVQTVMEGQVVRLADTAGFRKARNAIEREGVSRAQHWADHADIRIAVGDASRPATMAHARKLLRIGSDILVANKSDLVGQRPVGAVGTSAATGEIGPLQGLLSQRVTELAAGREFPAVTRERHRTLLADCLGHLERAVHRSTGAELQGEDMRLAIRALDRVLGRADPEAVLDRVFRSFCIGK